MKFLLKTLLLFMMPLWLGAQQTVFDIITDSPDHNILEAAIIAAELDDDLTGEGPFTVFAPTDAAFAALPDGLVDELLMDPTGELARILLYHVLGDVVRSTDLVDGQFVITLLSQEVDVTINNDGVFINDAQVTTADLEAGNGVVHVIDAVLVPEADPGLPSVVDIIVQSPIHNTLEAAVIAAELADDLNGEGPFTVFAPTDDAFAALPDGLVDQLLMDPTGDLAQILLYHVVGGDVRSTDLVDGMMATTLQGQDVTVSINADGIFINDAQVIIADLEADNGVVHVIDAVLVPTAEPELPATVVDIIVNSEIHNTLEAAVIAADLVDVLSGEGPFTVFAPTDDAFANLPAGVISELLNDPSGSLTEILLYHVIGADIRSTDLSDGLTATTIQGEDVTVTINDEGIFINDAQVILADVEAENGVVHVIDAVLIPSMDGNLPETVVDIIVESPVHNTLEAAVIAAELADDLSGEGPFTVFAPTDDAFAALPDGLVDQLLMDPTGDLAQILLYHVIGADVRSTDLVDGMMATTLQGQDVTVSINQSGIFINDAQVIIADLEAENGVVHVIDAVLVPSTEPELPATVVDIIVNSDVHNTLEAAVIAAELADDLSGEGPFTVFAPTDDAFAALPDGLVDQLLMDPTGDLAQILLYHVIGADVRSTDLVDGMMATTLQGQDVTVSINQSGIFINDAQVIIADLEAENGVVHVIDAVLVPSTEPELPATVVDIIVNSDVHNTLEAAVIAAELADDLSGEGPFTVFAPTDDAFAALPDGLVDQLLMDPTGDLAQILLYHVIGADVRSTDLVDGMMATTLQGQDVTVSINESGIFINDAQVIIADLEAENGVVHVIDAVLVPATEPQTGTASVQIIHNAFDETVGVYANGEEIIPSIAYLTATPYFEVPAGVDIEIELRSRRVFQPAASVFTTVNFTPDMTYVVGVYGTFDESDNVPVEFAIFDRATPNAEAREVGVQLFHGVSDAPAVDVVSGGASIFDDVSYGEFGADFLFIPAANGYRLDVTTADNSTTVGSYKLDIEWWKSNTLTIFATGSLANGTFYPYVALSNGGTYPIALWDGPPVMDDEDISMLRSGGSVALNPVTTFKTTDMTVAPNPFTSNTTVFYETSVETPTVMEVYDMGGNLIREINLGVQDAGSYTEDIDLGDKSAGMYMLRIVTNNEVITKPIIKVN